MTQVEDIMTRGARTLAPSEPVTAAAKAMRELDIGALPVCDAAGLLVGMVTDRDIVLRALAQDKAGDTPLSAVMSEDTCWCHADESVQAAAARMRDKQIRRMPVLDRDKRLVGVVSLGDLATQVDNAQSGQTLESVSQPTAGTPR